MGEGKQGKQGEKGSPLIRMYNVKEHYAVVEKVGRGSYGTVFKVRGLKDNKYYAIKKLENNDVKLQQQGFPITALREITLLKQIDHPNIIKLKEIILSRPNKRNLFRGSTFLVFQYMDHDFAGLFKMKRKFDLPEIKCIFKQLIEGVAYLHKNKIFHRDIKSANILLNDEGEVKLADFGLGRKVRQQNVFTYKVVTLWYRAPELLWGCKHYNDKIDVWSLGCVIVQFFTGEVLFKKESQSAQMQRIYEICGDFQANELRISQQASKSYQYLADMRPKKPYKKEIANYLRKMCPSITEITIQFIEGLLHLNPSKRLSCDEALRHPFFNQKPLACSNRQIAKQEYQCHQMFKDRSIKIERPNKKEYEKSSKPGFKDQRAYREQRKEKSISSQSKKREFSHSSSPSKQDSRSKQSRSRSRSRERQFRRRSRSKEEVSRRYTYDKKREREDDYRRDNTYRRQPRDDRKDRRQDYKVQKDRRTQEKERRPEEKERRPEEKDYRDKTQRRYKDERSERRKDDRYDRIADDRNDQRRDGKDDRRQKDDHRNQRRNDYRRDSKQKKYDKGRYQSRGYESSNKSGKYREDDKQVRRRQNYQGGKQGGKQKYSGEYRERDYREKREEYRTEKKDKFVFVREKGHRKKQTSSSSSGSSHSSHNYKKQKQHRNKYSYDRKTFNKKDHSGNGEGTYH